MKINASLMIVFLALVGGSVKSQNIFPSTGNVGVGTLIPQAPIDIKSNASGEQKAIQISDSSDNSSSWRSIVWRAAGQFDQFDFAKIRAQYGGGFANSKMVFSVADATKALQDRMMIDVNGNVGIGTATPSSPLTVATSASGTYVPVAEFYAANNTTPGYVSQLRFGQSASMRNTAEFRFAYQSNGGYTNRTDFGYWGEEQPVFSYLANGKVGVGTTDPEYKLTVQDPSALTAIGVRNTNSSGEGRVQVINSSGHYGALEVFGVDHPSSNVRSNTMLSSANNLVLATNTSVENGGSGKIQFQTGGWNYQTQTRMTIAANGNIGIGIDTPTYKLAVNGTVSTTKLKVTQTPWADYVFNTNYQLPTLKKVEEYINKHKHLEGIPSAKEVEKNGLDVGENQAALLKKIEELTLYMIEMNKQLETQQKRIAELEGQMNKK